MKDKQSGDAVLYCEGRDIDSREIKLHFNTETHHWSKVADSITEPEQFDDAILKALVLFMQDKNSYNGSAQDLTDKLIACSNNSFERSRVSKVLIQSSERLTQLGLKYSSGKSNGKRFVKVEKFVQDTRDTTLTGERDNAISSFADNTSDYDLPAKSVDTLFDDSKTDKSNSNYYVFGSDPLKTTDPHKNGVPADPLCNDFLSSVAHMLTSNLDSQGISVADFKPRNSQ